MKTLKYLIVCFAFLSFNNGFAQENKTEKERIYQDIFTGEERDSLQVWFYDRATVMGLQGDKRDEFYNIVVYHTFKMKNLNKPERGLSNEEIKTKVQELLQKQHREIKPLLDEKQYTYYLQTMTKIMDEVFVRRGWENGITL